MYSGLNPAEEVPGRCKKVSWSGTATSFDAVAKNVERVDFATTTWRTYYELKFWIFELNFETN